MNGGAEKVKDTQAGRRQLTGSFYMKSTAFLFHTLKIFYPFP